MSKEKLSHHDRPQLPRSEKDIEKLSTEERYQLAYKMRLDSRLRPITDPQNEEDIQKYEATIEELSQQFSTSELYQFYINSELVPLTDEDDIFYRIHRFFEGRDDTQVSTAEAFHHEAYVRFRKQGNSGIVYAALIDELGYGEEDGEIFHGSPDEPGTINYNRNLLVERFDFSRF